MAVSCMAFVGMISAKLEAVSEIPPLLVVSCVKGAINSVTLSTNTVSTFVDAAIGTGGNDSQLIGLVELNATKQVTSDQNLEIVQIVQAPETAPEDNNFPAFRETTGDSDSSSVATSWTAIQIWSNVNPAVNVAGEGAFVFRNSQQLDRATFDSSYGAVIATSSTYTFSDQVAVLAFYAVDDVNNDTTAGTYRAFFMITFNDAI